MAGLAHESRNALQRSQACVDVLEAKFGDDPEIVELVAGIQRAQEELHHLYEGVRGFAAPINLELESCDIASILKSAWVDTEVCRVGRAVLLQEAPPFIDTRCDVDSQAIKQVFRNLFENALQACSDEVEIQVHYDQQFADGQQKLSISIRDNGPGLPPEEAATIFDSFYTTKTVGTGLGLTVAKRIIASHNGELYLNTEYQNGAEFVVALPQ